MRTFATLLLFGILAQATAQRQCTTTTYTEALRTNKATAARMDEAVRFVQQYSRKFIYGISGATTGVNEKQVIRIPVVIHVLYSTAAQNISDAQIRSGIEALNRDFRRQNKDTVNTPERFKAIAADVEIEFQLATADPRGVVTTGIIRKSTAAFAFNMDDKIKFSSQGGDDAWDTKSYLNIWIGNTRRLLGYATMPGGDAAVDGLVINYTAFGTINTAAPYELGRTAVHEIGHWLGLYHIWGDEACGDDEVDDTPRQGGYTSGCPTGFRSTCNNAPDGDMYMNYMDFTNDACMNLFTLGQKARMRAQFAPGGPRASILASTGLNTPWVDAIPAPKEDTLIQVPLIQFYPNPTAADITLQCNAETNWSGSWLYLVNTTGTVLQKIQLTARTQKIPLAQLRPGIYFLEGYINNTKVHQRVVKL